LAALGDLFFRWAPLIARGGFCNRVRGKRAGEDAAIPELHKKEIDAYIDSIVLYVPQTEEMKRRT
jgi:hypothetical protein